MKRTLADFARACGGRLEGADRPWSAVSTDSRTIRPGELFVALTGPRFDGGEFLPAAHAAGAAGAVVRAVQALPIPQIVVSDSLAALSAAATAWRAQFRIPVIGVGGSNGKTTVKEMIAAILSQNAPCLATRGNLNNHIGVPLTLLRLDSEHRAAVIEMGANRPGEVAALAALAAPDIGLITNAGAEHLEGFGSIEGAARAEGEMVAALAPEGTAIINADDPFCALWLSLTRARVVRFGLAPGADFTASGRTTEIVDGSFHTRFTLECPAGRTPVELNLAGAHNVTNALAAAAAASSAGATLEHIRAGLALMRPVPGRLQLKRAARGAWLIDDSYNANPSSVHAAIEVLASLEAPRWLVLGDMAELGEHARASHIEVGALARARGIARLYATGPLSALTVESFGKGGRWFPDAEALTRTLGEELAPEAHVLVKGSRVNRLERVVGALVGPGGPGTPGGAGAAGPSAAGRH